jgi:hypothetical protein
MEVTYTLNSTPYLLYFETDMDYDDIGLYNSQKFLFLECCYLVLFCFVIYYYTQIHHVNRRVQRDERRSHLLEENADLNKYEEENLIDTGGRSRSKNREIQVAFGIYFILTAKVNLSQYVIKYHRVDTCGGAGV